MAARRCSLCGVNYPAITQFETCPIHDQPTELKQGVSADDGWQEALTVLKKKHEESLRPIPVIRGVEAFEADGLLWVSQESLYRAGARFNRLGESFRLFELEDGWIYETQGWDDPNRRWWVERVTTAVMLPEDPAVVEAVEASRAD